MSNNAGGPLGALNQIPNVGVPYGGVPILLSGPMRPLGMMGQTSPQAAPPMPDQLIDLGQGDVLRLSGSINATHVIVTLYNRNTNAAYCTLSLAALDQLFEFRERMLAHNAAERLKP